MVTIISWLWIGIAVFDLVQHGIADVRTIGALTISQVWLAASVVIQRMK